MPASRKQPVAIGAITPAKVTLRGLLGEQVSRLGFTAAAVETFVERAQITYWRPGQPVFAAGDAQDLTNFLISGAVRVGCLGYGGTPVTVQIVRPGRLFGTAWFFDRPRPREFWAIAHVDSVVAMVSQETMIAVLARMPPARALQLMTHTWRILARLLSERSELLALPLRERLLRELGTLAHDFGRPEAHGTRIDLPLTHADLAGLVVASRPNVSRVLSGLRREGRLTARDGRYVLAG